MEQCRAQSEGSKPGASYWLKCLTVAWCTEFGGIPCPAMLQCRSLVMMFKRQLQVLEWSTSSFDQSHFNYNLQCSSIQGRFVAKAKHPTRAPALRTIGSTQANMRRDHTPLDVVQHLCWPPMKNATIGLARRVRGPTTRGAYSVRTRKHIDLRPT